MKHEIINGTYNKVQKGFGFVKIENSEEEIYIPKEKSLNALNGDFVCVEITAKKTIDKKAEGKITKIIRQIRFFILTFNKKLDMISSITVSERLK